MTKHEVAENVPTGCETDPTFNALPNVADALCKLARQLGAECFHLYEQENKAQKRRFAPCLDTSFPNSNPASVKLLELLPLRAFEIVTTAAYPLWWRGKNGTYSATNAVPQWAEEIAMTCAPAGLILPLRNQEEHPGIVIFTGNNLIADTSILLDIHGQCHALFNQFVNLRPPKDVEPPLISKRELQCLKLTANGLTSHDIAKRLGLSVHTANQYLANCVQKLDAVNRVHALAKALRTGLIQ